MIQAEIIADSLSPQRNRLTTFVVTFPRIVLAEFNTHRMFSKNSASSRAIPFNKMVQMVEENPFIPIAWQKDHKGMQGDEYFINENDIKLNEVLWLKARDNAINIAKALNFGNEKHSDGVTKQLCNRLLEPFMWHKVIVTSSEEGLENFFKLRCPQYSIQGYKGVEDFRSKKDAKERFPEELEHLDKLDWLSINNSQAEIHIQALAECMWDAYNESTPKQLKAGEWHIPFGDNFDEDNIRLLNYGKIEATTNVEALYQNTKIEISIARCARISYQTLGDNPVIDYEKDLQLFERLKESEHWSPFEHVARAMSNDEFMTNTITYSGNADLEKEDSGLQVEIKSKQGIYTMDRGWCRNFRGFIQYRALTD